MFLQQSCGLPIRAPEEVLGAQANPV